MVTGIILATVKFYGVKSGTDEQKKEAYSWILRYWDRVVQIAIKWRNW
jgi:hypothetical protein